MTLAYFLFFAQLSFGNPTVCAKNNQDPCLTGKLQIFKPGSELHPKEVSETPTGAGAAAQLRYRKRADGSGKVPPNALEKGKKALEELPEMAPQRNPFTDDAGIFSWSHQGPNRVGGRIRALLMLDDNTRLVGSVGGGIWKSTDQGNSWTPINDFLPTLSISSLTRDASNGNQIYAGTGETAFGNSDALPGAGVYRSMDGGNSWSQMASTTNWSFSRLFAHPFISGTVYAGVGGGAPENGVWRSTDSGVSWTKILSTNSACVDVKVDVESWNDIVACTRGGDVFYSGNGGTNWTDKTNGNWGLPTDGGRCEVAFALDSKIYISMDRNGGEIYRANDGASAFQLRNSGSNYLGTQGWYANTIWVAKHNLVNLLPPFNLQELVIVGGLNVYRSIDGGTNLNQISNWLTYHIGGSAHADQHGIVPIPGFNATNPFPTREVWVVNDGGVQRTMNIDTVVPISPWDNMNSNMSITQFYGAAVTRDGSLMVGGSQDNDTVRGPQNDPGGWFQGKTGDGGYCAFDPVNEAVVYCEYVNLGMFRSTDWGFTWLPITNGLSDAGSGNTSLFIAPFKHHPTLQNVLYAGGVSIWKTTNGGLNWSSVRGPRTGKCSAMDVTAAFPNKIWVGYDSGDLGMSDDGGSTWTVVPKPPVTGNQFVTDIAIRPSNPNHVMVTYGGYEQDRVWFTPDNGNTWENRSGANPIPAIQINSIIWHQSAVDWVYIGTDLGVLASDDAGLHWNRTPKYGNINNDGPIHVDVEELFWDNQDNLYAATHGRGIWRAWVPGTIFVDKNFSGTQVGTLANPFNRVDTAVNSTGPAHTYSIKSNTYIEGPKVYNKRGRFVARDGTVTIR